MDVCMRWDIHIDSAYPQLPRIKRSLGVGNSRIEPVRQMLFHGCKSSFTKTIGRAQVF